MKKLLLLLMAFLALTPPLRAENPKHSGAIFQTYSKYDGVGEYEIPGTVYVTYLTPSTGFEERLPIIENGVRNPTNYAKIGDWDYPNGLTDHKRLKKIEYFPTDGGGDALIVEFESLTNESTNVYLEPNSQRYIAVGSKCAARIYTRFGGTISGAKFDFAGKTGQLLTRAPMPWIRIWDIDGERLGDYTTTSGYNNDAATIAAKYNTKNEADGSIATGEGYLIESVNTANATTNYANNYSKVTFDKKEPKEFTFYNYNETLPLYYHMLWVDWTEGNPPTPVINDVDFNISNGYKENGQVHFSKEVSLKDFSVTNGSSIYYYFSTTAPVNEVEISDENRFNPNNSPVFTQSGYLTLVCRSEEYGLNSEPTVIRLEKLNNIVFDNLADAQKEQYNNNIVTFSCPLLIEGIQNTQNNAKFMYVRDPQGNAIKFVNNGADVFFHEPNYKVGQEIPAYGITGVYRHTEGWPQIEVYVGPGDDYRRYSADAEAATTDFGDYDPTRSTFGADDFNRHVIVNNLIWTGSESKFTDSEGKSLNAYGRFTAYQGVLSTLKEGKSYTVEGFIGQIKGEPTIFPMRYAADVTVLAPNPIIGEKDADGWIDVNIISDKVTLTLDQSNFPAGTDVRTKENGKTGTWALGTSWTLAASDFKDGVLELVVYSMCNQLQSAQQKIRFHKREVTKEYTTLAEFNTEFRDATDTPKPNTDDTKYYRFTGSAEVRAVTPKYLYLRDADCEAGKESISSLLLYNENGWQSAVTNLSGATGSEPKVGDILTNFALIPDRTQLQNLRGYATNFARTLRRTQDGTGIAPTPKTKEATEAFSDDDRMVRYIVKGATVDRDDKGVYTITNMPGNPVLNIGDVFEVTGGWATAWDRTKPFDIEGIVLRNGDAGYALAFYGFTAGESSPAMAVPTLEGVDDTNLTTGLNFATTAKVVLALEDDAATANIWYTTDGSDPLNNPDRRKPYEGPFEISATTTVKAYAAVAGAMPSAVVERTFTRTTSDRRYIINFLNQGQPEEMYNFTGTVAVAAIGKEYMFVRGAVGHYLPVKLTAEGASWTDKGYAVGDHLTGFMLGYHEEGAEGAVNRMGRVADAATFATWGAAITPAADETIDVTNPEETSAISSANARRMVTVKGVHITRSTAKADSWTMTEANGEGASYALVPEVLGADMSAVSGEGQQFDVTGFVMYSAEGALEMWPMSISRLTPAANVAITIDGKPAGATAEFTSSVKLEFSCPTPGAVIQYQFYNENSDPEPERWYTYEGRPVVIDESCRLHARATAPGFATGNHTHLDLVRLDQTAAPAISVAEGTESSTVTISAEAGTVISWWTSEEATAKIYTAPITITATTIVYATAKAEGKVESPVTHKLVKVAGSAAPSDKISGKVNISARLNDEGKPVVTIAPADESLTPGSYTIYYTLNEGVVLTPENGTEYTGEFTMEESGLVTAILVESGKSAGEPCYLNVWAGVTGIDGISGAEGESEVRVDGDSIIAPQGSEVYDLSGRRVNPTGLAGGIYIVRIPGGKAVKVRI